MLKAKQLTKSYNGNIVLNNLSIDFDDNKVNVIKGASGCGKTTLLRILAGLTEKDGGETEGFAGKKISLAFQEDRLLKELNPVKNISLVLEKRISAENIKADLLSVGLTKTDLEKPCASFSGGMARRVAVVRAVMYPSKIILLDEPFKGLDDASKIKVSKYLAEKIKNRTVIAVTHDEEDFNGFDCKIININNC